MIKTSSVKQGLLIFFLILFSSDLISQSLNKIYRSVDKIIDNIPDSVTKSTDLFNDYLKNTFKSDEEIVRAIYCWIGHHIEYKNDSSNCNQDQFSEIKFLSNNVLLKRKTNCFGYSSLFYVLCKGSNIKSIVIDGYIHESILLNSTSHSWVAAELNHKWYLFDPTWASGYITDSMFCKQFSNKFFMIKPQKFIRSHMPFDPIFQFLEHPLTEVDFRNSDYNKKTQSPYFNFKDSLENQDSLTSIKILEKSIRRIKQNGANYPISIEYLSYKQKSLLALLINMQIEQLNLGAFYYNKGVDFYNTYIGAKNQRFTPPVNDAENFIPLDSCQMYLNRIYELMQNILTQKYKSNIFNNLMEFTDDLTIHLSEERAYLRDFLDKRKNKVSYSPPNRINTTKKYYIVRKIKK